MWVSITSDAACAAALQQAVEDYGIVDTATLQAVLHHDASGFARALCTALQAEPPPAAEIGTMTDMAVLNVATQTALTGDVVDTSTAEAMIDEAVCMMDEAEARERAAEERAHVWLANAELGSALLRKAEDRTDCAHTGRQAAEAVTAAERAARRVLEQMLKAEAALADAALADVESERSARRCIETEYAMWRAARGKGGRGGRGGPHYRKKLQTKWHIVWIDPRVCQTILERS